MSSRASHWSKMGAAGSEYDPLDLVRGPTRGIPRSFWPLFHNYTRHTMQHERSWGLGMNPGMNSGKPGA